jgi:uncharacterized protein
MVSKIRALGWTLVALLGCSPMVQAKGDEKSISDDARVLSSQGFLGAHPDLKWRLEGMSAYEAGDGELALAYFRRAAKFADKPAQGMIGEMLWKGDLVAQDRAAAYAWMDLAAERLFRPMLMRREIFWRSMNEDERKRAIEVGRGLYAEFGDEVAKPRMERKLRSERRKLTGSRTGFVGSLQIVIPTLSGDVTIDGATYYHPDYWQPERYWAWQEKGWKNPPKGTVDVGPIAPSQEAKQ